MSQIIQLPIPPEAVARINEVHGCMKANKAFKLSTEFAEFAEAHKKYFFDDEYHDACSRLKFGLIRGIDV